MREKDSQQLEQGGAAHAGEKGWRYCGRVPPSVRHVSQGDVRRRYKETLRGSSLRGVTGVTVTTSLVTHGRWPGDFCTRHRRLHRCPVTREFRSTSHPDNHLCEAEMPENRTLSRAQSRRFRFAGWKLLRHPTGWFFSVKNWDSGYPYK